MAKILRNLCAVYNYSDDRIKSAHVKHADITMEVKAFENITFKMRSAWSTRGIGNLRMKAMIGEEEYAEWKASSTCSTTYAVIEPVGLVFPPLQLLESPEVWIRVDDTSTTVFDPIQNKYVPRTGEKRYILYKITKDNIDSTSNWNLSYDFVMHEVKLLVNAVQKCLADYYLV